LAKAASAVLRSQSLESRPQRAALLRDKVCTPTEKRPRGNFGSGPRVQTARIGPSFCHRFRCVQGEPRSLECVSCALLPDNWVAPYAASRLAKHFAKLVRARVANRQELRVRTEPALHREASLA